MSHNDGPHYTGNPETDRVIFVNWAQEHLKRNLDADPQKVGKDISREISNMPDEHVSPSWGQIAYITAVLVVVALLFWVVWS